MRYLEPETVDEALGLLAEHGDGGEGDRRRPVAADPDARAAVDMDALIGLKAIAPLRRHRRPTASARIGAMVTHSEVERDARIAERWPLLQAAEAAVSTLQVRNRGTLCGNVAHAFPTADPPARARRLARRVVHLASKAGGERDGRRGGLLRRRDADRGRPGGARHRGQRCRPSRRARGRRT